jgi:hypothetical protein
MGGRQLKQLETSYVCQHRATDVLSVVVPRHVSRGWPTSSCVLVDSLAAQVVRQPGHFHDVVAKMFWVSLVDKFQILIIFYVMKI